MSAYTTPDPADPPMVEVLVDGTWYAGHVRAQWRDPDGTWRISVQHSTTDGQTIGTFTTDRVRPDDTDYTHGRSS